MVHLLKRIFFYLFIAASIVAAVLGYFRLKESKEPVVSVQEHIPGTALCVIETKSAADLVTQLTRQNLIWNALLTEQSIQKAHNCINFLDSLLKTNEEVKAALDGSSMFCSFFKEKDKIRNLVQFKLKEQNDASIFESFFEKSLKKSSSVSSFDAYELNINENTWLICLNQGLICIASEFSILDAAVNLEKSNSLAVDSNYVQLVKLNGDQKNLVYLNHHHSSLFDKTLFNHQSLFTVDLQLNEITCNGYLMTEGNSFFNLLKQQKEGSVDGYEFLPNNAISITGIYLDKPKLFYENLVKQTSKDLAQTKSSAWKTLNDSALYDIQSEFLENIDGEIVSANYWVNDTACSILSVRVVDGSKTNALFKLMSDSLHTINRFQLIKLPKAFQSLFSFFDVATINEYAGLNENSLILFSNKKALDLYINATVNLSFLGKNSSFMEYAKQNLTQESNFIYYENSKEIKNTSFSRFLTFPELNTGDDVLSRSSLTVKNSRARFQFRLSATHAREENSLQINAHALWSCLVDSMIQSPVHVFTNHITSENELCFQDNARQFYLTSSTGKILWKKRLNENLQSKVYTVDIFKNGKLQMLFNTENYIHLLDRNGNYVQGYPVRMPAPITSPITLLDYDNTKDYRLFIACADKKIYNYSLYGIKTDGYVPLKTDAVVTLPINYLKIGSSDYLIAVDERGKPYVFSRKGEGRIDFKDGLPEHLDQVYIVAGNNLDNTKIVCLDNKNNTLVKLSFSDRKESLKIGDDVQGFNSAYDLVNDDTQQDILAYGNGAIYAYDLFTNQILECFNDQAVYDAVQVVNTSNHQWIVAFDKAGQKVDLINTEGKIIGSIPQITQKPLSLMLYKNNKTYLIIVSGKIVSCQELN